MTPYQRALWFDRARRIALEAEEQKAPESEAERAAPEPSETPPARE